MPDPSIAPALALVAAAASDLTRREIPDVLTGVLALGGAAHAAIEGGTIGLGWALVAATATFAVGAAFFHLGQLGGGDVKLAAAVMLWLPADRIGAFLLVMALAGGLVCAIAAASRFVRVARRDGAVAGLRAARAATAPYGVAIAAGGLAALPWESA